MEKMEWWARRVVWTILPAFGAGDPGSNPGGLILFLFEEKNR
jgi:hypothetical protein